MALTPEDKDDIKRMIAEATARQASGGAAGMSHLKGLATHPRIVWLPGSGQSRYLYGFTFDEDGTIRHRLRVSKRDMRAFLSSVIAEDPGEPVAPGASVTIAGDLDLTSTWIRDPDRR